MRTDKRGETITNDKFVSVGRINIANQTKRRYPVSAILGNKYEPLLNKIIPI